MALPAELIAALGSTAAGVAERAARELRLSAEEDARLLAPLGTELLSLAMGATDLRVRWNLIQVVGRLSLRGRQRDAAIDWLLERLQDASPFTRTFALQALMDLSAGDAALRARVVPVAREFAENGTAAMRARARKLLKG